MTHDAALALLQQEAGKALDPAVVQMFVKMLPSMTEAAAARSKTPAAPPLARADHRARPPGGRLPAGTLKGTTVFEDIAHAHREIYALYEIAQTMGTSLGVSDTMALISSKLISLVPFTSCALFLFDEEADTLRCRFATGAEADAIGTMTVRSGQGLTGWVARNRRPLVNARPSADFEAAGLTDSATTLQSALVAPLVFNDRFIGTLAVYHDAVRLLHRRSPPPARSRQRAGLRGHPQLDRVRADAGRFAHRSADRPAEHALHVHAPDARAGARRSA